MSLTTSVAVVRDVYQRIVGDVLKGPVVPLDDAEIPPALRPEGPLKGAFRATWTGEVLLQRLDGWYIYSAADRAQVVHTDAPDAHVPMVASVIGSVARQFVGAGGSVAFLHRAETWSDSTFASAAGLPEIVKRVFKSSIGHTIVFASKRHHSGTTIAIMIPEAGVTMLGEQQTPEMPVQFEFLPVGSVPPF